MKVQSIYNLKTKYLHLNNLMQGHCMSLTFIREWWKNDMQVVLYARWGFTRMFLCSFILLVLLSFLQTLQDSSSLFRYLHLFSHYSSGSQENFPIQALMNYKFYNIYYKNITTGIYFQNLYCSILKKGKSLD